MKSIQFTIRPHMHFNTVGVIKSNSKLSFFVSICRRDGDNVQTMHGPINYISCCLFTVFSYFLSYILPVFLAWLQCNV